MAFILVFITLFFTPCRLLGADFTSAAVLISFGALIGKTTPTQLILLTLLEVPLFAVNEVIGRRYLGVSGLRGKEGERM